MTTETTTTNTTGTETTTTADTTGYVESPELTAAKARAAALYATPASAASAPATTATGQVLGLTDLNVEAYTLFAAEGNLAQARAKLYDGDGRPLYAEAEHQRQLEKLQAGVDATVKSAVEMADRYITAATATIRRAEEGDPGLSLDDAIIQRAAVRKPFVDQDVAALPAADLLRRLEDVRASKDQALMYAHWNAANHRVAAIEREVRANPDARVSLTAQERRALGEVIDALAVELRGPQALKEAQVARQNLPQARDVKARANRLYDAAHERDQQIEQDLRASGRYSI